MKIAILAFAQLKDHLTTSQSIEVATGTTVKQVISMLIAKNSSAASILGSCRGAVGNDFVNPDYILKDGDQLALLPPSSGG